MQYTDFRKEFTSLDWPSGSYRTEAVFLIEKTKRVNEQHESHTTPLPGYPTVLKRPTTT